MNHGYFIMSLNYTLPYDYLEIDLKLYVENMNSTYTNTIKVIIILINTNTKMIL